MAISTTGRIVKVKKKGELVSVENRKRNYTSAMKYNHIRIQFSDESERHLLFTDSQINRARDRANKNEEVLPKTTWIREIWYEGLIDVSAADIDRIISQRDLPDSAKTYNHIRVNLDGEEVHMLFTDNEIRIGLERAENNCEHLPKVSWFSDEIK